MGVLETIADFDRRSLLVSQQSKSCIARYRKAISHSADGHLYLIIGSSVALLGDAGAQFLTHMLLAFSIERPLYWVLKNTLRRRRPAEALPNFQSHIVASDKFSFPSGHSCAAFLFVSLLVLYFGLWTLDFGLWTLAAAFVLLEFCGRDVARLSRSAFSHRHGGGGVAGGSYCATYSSVDALVRPKMKILYGVQGTGNGHISRARAMARAFAATDHSVDYLFSGRALDRFFAMEPFAQFQYRKGLTFASRGGCVSYLGTALTNNYWRFVRDVAGLDMSGYNLVLTDFEPVTAWAGWLRGKTVVSLGHQPAFDHRVPVAGRDLRSSLVMRMFAPGSVRLGMHWNSFQAPILPPIINLPHVAITDDVRKVLVYLPFEDQEHVRLLLAQIPEYDFYIYAPDNQWSHRANLHSRPTALKGFQSDLAACSSVICNAGFELSSECLALGKRLLVKPLGGQMEQASNALALQQLGYASVLDRLEADSIRRWLTSASGVSPINYPDVATAIVTWLSEGDLGLQSQQNLSDRLWKEVVTQSG